ncbi:MAG: hypothetical protein J0M08_09400 [Bacteroidetes bacterium]|nr:hypothetical protein [Bacteroidota bacterium]
MAQSFEIYKKDTINKLDSEGKKHGFWIFFGRMKKLPGYADDQKVEEGKFSESKKIGLWKEYFANGNIKNKIPYENGRPSGYAVIYHENGKIYEEGLWKNNRWIGDYKLYYDNGQVAQEFKFNTSGKREGPQKYYYENGQVMIEGSWQEGKEAGLLKEYHENGDIKAEKYFNGGAIDPAKTKTYEPKKPIVKEDPPPPAESPKVVPKPEEKPNLPNQIFTGEGQWTLYNKNKQISKDGFFHKGRLVNGKVYFYSEDGILIRIAVYKDGGYVGDAVIEDK